MQTIIALVIVAGAVLLAIFSLIRRSKKGACGCDRCPVHENRSLKTPPKPLSE